MSWPTELPLLVVIALLWLLLAALLSPLEVLGWWGGWFGDEPSHGLPQRDVPPRADPPTRYVVYLSGVNTVSGVDYVGTEQAFLEALQDAMPDIVLITDVYPYSVLSRALTGQRTFAWFWRLMHRSKTRRFTGLVGLLINARNLFQVSVSADGRYGPLYNSRMAQLVAKGLLRHGFQPDATAAPVVLLGYSGGGQIAVGLTPYLRAMIYAPVVVISLGGVLTGDAGVSAVSRLYHVYGSLDRVQAMGLWGSPGRWPVFVNSPWNRARRSGRVIAVPVGMIKHNGPRGYLDAERALLPGITPRQRVLLVLVRLIQRELPDGDDHTGAVSTMLTSP